MNHYLSYAELENLRHLIDRHQKVAEQLEQLSARPAASEIQAKLQEEAVTARQIHEHLLSTYR